MKWELLKISPPFLALLVSASSAAGQNVDLSGEWQITYDSRTRQRGGEVRVLDRGEGTLVLMQVGDSLRRMWNERREITGGVVRGNQLEFWTDSLDFEATGPRGVRTVRVRLMWRGIYRDGRIDGTWHMRAELPPRNWEADRR